MTTTITTASGDVLVVGVAPAQATDPDGPKVVTVLLGGVLTLETLTADEVDDWCAAVFMEPELDYPADGIYVELTDDDVVALTVAVGLASEDL